MTGYLNEDAALEIAVALKKAHDSGRTRSAAWRLEQLKAIERMMVECEERFANALQSDLGKSFGEAWFTEVSFVTKTSKYTRKNLKRWMREQRVNTPGFAQPGRSWIRPEPLGTVLIISPWNYPLELCLTPLITAIAAGNCAVLKPSELAPATAAALSELLPRYLDPECFRVVEGGVRESTLLLEQRWDHIVFTGGEHVARIVMTAAAQHLTPVTLELGGKSPCVIMPDADIDITARRIAWGKCTNAGQTCIAPDYILTDSATAEKLVTQLKKEIGSMYGNDPAESGDYGRIINSAHFDRITALLDGENIVHGGRANRERLHLEPTIVSPARPDSPLMKEEIFGPVLPIVHVESFDEAVAFIRARPKPLSAYFFGRGNVETERMVDEISAGSVCINDVIVFMGVDELPFGGVGMSGTGTYNGEAGFRQLSHQKAVLKRSLRPDFALRYAPLTENKLKWLRKLM